MILRHEHLSRHPDVFQAMTGLTLREQECLCEDFLPLFQQADQKRRQRPQRRRAPGGGPAFSLLSRDQLVLVLVWLRHYPTNEVLGYLFGVSDSTTSRCIRPVLPLLETLGLRTMQLPDPKTARRKTLPELLRETPALAVVIDSFEQRVQRPQPQPMPACPPTDSQQATTKHPQPADPWYSGKKKQHTIKSQVAVDETDGRIVDVSESVPGPTADIELLRRSRVNETLPPGGGGPRDLAYLGSDKSAPGPARGGPPPQPHGQHRPPAEQRHH